MKIVGLRVDIDTVRDAEALPALLELLKKYEAKATFFAAAGYDRVGMNIVKYIGKPRELIEKMPLKRYGLKNLLLSVVHPAQLQEHPNLKRIIEDEHELGLHGYEHHEWANNLNKSSRTEIRKKIETGCKLFREAFKSKPASFASPGFKATANFLLAIEGFKFKYSSDFLCGDFLYGDSVFEKPFYPVVSGRELSTLQVPVTLDFEDVQFIDLFRKKLNDGNLLTFYLHPHATLFKNKIFEQVLETYGTKFRTFAEVAEEWE
jgi:peptidoglycan/xylan/chitin deacetylase (PgdA/CDA1 family)